ncbi:MAG: DEAD/DEAH box helicase, partial [Acidobacteria bacterium]|nr:DEAD/DEAH box helicase [Acidobacteriota bacterium]
GGCLADDMGLGKTVQVLALLESRRQARQSRATPEDRRPGPSLVVVPKSLVFNWQAEAERFAPRMRFLDYTGPGRSAARGSFADYDLVVTTYGILRRDIVHLKDFEFDYAILDEAQAIKNPKSATAKASRLLAARHRVALTGTPIENRVGELMSILDFLNPGLFGPVGEFELSRAARDQPVDAEGNPHPEIALIAGAVKPFVLRRTKRQVAKDLPERVQQVVTCELPPAQRRDYDQLRRHYRQHLLRTVENRGLARSKIVILEALLRLRQAACHPGLIDPHRRGEASGKLDMLLSLLEEVLEEGHKALVFSQFVSFLSIARARLDGKGIAYAYIDGKTRDRESQIRRFQEDPDCRLFLISLKAGGLGLNLTAAEYVFLLDPWWNPAVEAQAIDRTHRIGQTRKVFAYSLIAHDTVEEKVLHLQTKKRELADAIIQADSSLIRTLSQEDLAELLS